MLAMVWVDRFGPWGLLCLRGSKSHFAAQVYHTPCQVRGWSDNHFDRAAARKLKDVNTASSSDLSRFFRVGDLLTTVLIICIKSRDIGSLHQ
jgi:hypothetical protein